MPATVCTAKASYKKLPGLLELTGTHLQWTQDGAKAPSIRVLYAEAASLFCSKDGSPQVKLKIKLLPSNVEHFFTFTSPLPVAVVEREKFKQELTTIIARNRSSGGLLAASAPGTAAANLATPKNGAGTPATPKTPAVARLGGVAKPGAQAARGPAGAMASRAPSVASERRGTPVITGTDPANEFRLRAKVLKNNPELGALHKELVMTGQITEADFWDGREHLILAEAASESQKKGKPGQLVDPRPEAVEGGEIKIKITPQLVHDIFDEYPIVAKAYSENVPENLSEAQFWQRYFQSKLFHAHRASIRSSATQHVVKDDPIFDKYLEKDDDELEPKRQRKDHIDVFVDLAATLEDHVETGNDKDVTMRAGRQKAVLPLIRKFNEHSERLLNSALGDSNSAKRRKLDNGEAYAPIDIDDLHDTEASDGIVLDMQDRQRYFEGRMGGSQESTTNKNLDVNHLKEEAISNLHDWDKKLAQFKVDRKPSDTALLAMTQNVATRLDARSRKNDIPDGLFRQMTTCQTAANEFLRQYWLAAFPPPSEIQTIPSTPQQRAAKAHKMIEYISKTRDKVNALVQAAQRHGIDPSRVEIALKPVLDASDHALNFHRKRRPAK